MDWQPRFTEGTQVPFDGLPSLIAKILCARGYSNPDLIKAFLSPSLKDLKHPHTLQGMQLATERLWQAFINEERVCIYADFDLDGTSGLALLLEGLKLLGYENLTYYQPSRLSEGYGVHVHAIDKLKEDGVQVLITVDVGITANKALAHAKELGIDVILTDHHLPGETLPEAYCVINPNQGDCDSKLGHLCGAGVAYYLFLALKMEFTKRGNPTGHIDAKEILDCFIIGTLTDMVPLKDENRVLTRHGLKQLEKTKRPGIRALMRALEIENRSLCSADVGFKLAPKLNALSRMDRGLRPIDIFVEADPARAESLVAEVLQNNEDRKDLQSLAINEALAQAELQKGKPFVWVYSEAFHRGVIGLVATRLVQELGVPAFVGSLDNTGMIAGSGRAPEGYHLLSAFEAAQKVLTRSGGHAQAAGFELRGESAQEFMQLLDLFYANNEDAKAQPKIFDVEVKLEEINASAMSWMEHLEPFGQGFETPILKVSDAEIKSLKVLRGGHLKIEIAHPGSQHRLPALYFSPPQLLAERLNIGQRVDVLVEAQWNYFAGRRSLQLILQGLKPRN